MLQQCQKCGKKATCGQSADPGTRSFAGLNRYGLCCGYFLAGGAFSPGRFSPRVSACSGPSASPDRLALCSVACSILAQKGTVHDAHVRIITRVHRHATKPRLNCPKTAEALRCRPSWRSGSVQPPRRSHFTATPRSSRFTTTRSWAWKSGWRGSRHPSRSSPVRKKQSQAPSILTQSGGWVLSTRR